ncbi:spermatogenesis- and oogenesis-specific basic helix-loop-helix-containing protein 2 [Ambystoma mexicanum]|uniref:spermatogenesis- and oogenesis-specific basic helix-loop-helix-containing protein 2 n=1 Tax=Ambystoma mexicanum TaxID=8296 RepID=UPI0037E76658
MYISNCFDTITYDCTAMPFGKRSSKKDVTCKVGRRAHHSVKDSLLHSTNEKSRRKRIKECCDRLHALLPNIHEKKTDVASVLEATVAHMKSIHDIIPLAVVSQIANKLESNERFCKQPSSPPSRQCFMERREICSAHQHNEKISADGMPSEWIERHGLQAINRPAETTRIPMIRIKKSARGELRNLFLCWSYLRPTGEITISSGVSESRNKYTISKSAPVPYAKVTAHRNLITSNLNEEIACLQSNTIGFGNKVAINLAFNK